MPNQALIDTIFLAVAAALILGALLKGFDLARGPRSTSQLMLCVFLASLGASFAAQSLSGRRLQDEIYTNLGQLTGNGLTLVGASSALMMVLYILHPPHEAKRRVGPRLGALVVVLTTMTVLFITNPRERYHFAVPGPDIPPPPVGILAYYAVYLIYLSAAMADLAVVTRGYVGHDPYLRAGLRIVAAGAIMGLVYTSARACTLLLGVSLDLPRWIDFTVGAVLPSIAVLLIVAGATFSRWARSLVLPFRWGRQGLAYWRLAPLWQAAHDACPGIMLEVDPSWRHAGMRLYRRIIEIQDAQLLINVYLPPSVREAAVAAATDAGLTGPEFDATVEAAVYAAGLPLLREDHDDSTTAGGPIEDHSPTVDTEPGHGGLLAMARQLEQVSKAFESSPLVRQFAKAHETEDERNLR